MSITTLKEYVCKEFAVKKKELEILGYNNIDRQAILCLVVNYGGMTLKEVGQKYGERSYFSVSKEVSSFRQRLVKDHKLQKQFKNILSNVQM